LTACPYAESAPASLRARLKNWRRIGKFARLCSGRS